MSGPLPRIVRVHEVPPSGLTVPISATSEERAAIAAELDLVGLDRLAGTLTVRPQKRGFRVEGEIAADVVQSCVVTLEPVAGSVRETIDVTYAPVDVRPAAAAAEIDVTVDESDPPEPLEGNEIDVGALVLEHLVLGLDPYPRAPGATFEPPAETVEEPVRRSPFADLEKLRKR